MNNEGLDKLRNKYRQTLTGYIGFIKDFHLIEKEKIEVSEEEYKHKYQELLGKWNSLVPEYNQLLKDSEALRNAYDESLSENRILMQKLNEETIVPGIRKILFLGASPISEVRHVIGMKKSVPDEAAIAFAVGFYAALGAGKDIHFAFKMGIVRIKLEGISGSEIPVLIG
jgi:hypothetical protein